MTSAAPAIVALDPRRYRRQRVIDRLVAFVLGLCALVVVLPVLGMIGYLVLQGGRLVDWGS